MYLKGSVFDRPQWQTHVKTNRITTKERVLGHMIGPGMVYFFYSTFLGLRERAKKVAEDRGEVYIAPEEQDRLEMEAAAKEMEAARIADLKEKCEKKGLDFEAENQKYLDKLAARQAKAEAKAARRKK